MGNETGTLEGIESAMNLSNRRVMSIRTEYLVRNIRTEQPWPIMPMPTYWIRLVCSSPRLSLQSPHPLVTASRSAIAPLSSAICPLPSFICPPPSVLCPLLLIVVIGVQASAVRLAISYTTSPESSGYYTFLLLIFLLAPRSSTTPLQPPCTALAGDSLVNRS